MTPLGSLARPYEARMAPSSKSVAALMTMALLPEASSLATMLLLGQSSRRRDCAGATPGPLICDQH